MTGDDAEHDAPPGLAHLVVVNEPRPPGSSSARAANAAASRVFEVRRSPCVIGRAADVDIALPAGTVGRRHAQLFWDAGERGWRVVDLRSAGGTFVNGTRAGAASNVLVDGDRIVVGNITLRFVLGELPLLHDVERRGAWLTFNAFAPTLAYAVPAAGDVTDVHTAVDDDRVFYKLAWDDVAHASEAVALEIVDVSARIATDVAGVSFGDVTRRTRAQAAHLDVRLTLALLALLLRTRCGAPVFESALFTWRGDVVVGVQPWDTKRADNAVQLLIALDFVRPIKPRDGLNVSRADDPDVVDPLLRRALHAIEEAAAVSTTGSPRSRAELLALVDDALRLAGGPPSRDDVRGLVMNLFPEQAARDARVREELGLISHEELVRLIKT